MAPELIAGRYRRERVIGRGGMGSVWLCLDERLGRQVAVKQVGGLAGESNLHLARALREARHSAALNHPNVVAVFDAFEEGDHVCLVMEYVPSRTLDELVRDQGALPPETAARIGADVADGLAVAHALGTVHRDVKPSNVLVRDDDGRALIADFGIARTLGQEQLTRTGMVTGTPAYFAPELARGQEPTPASDVWALGASLHLAVEGVPAYAEQVNAIALLNTIASEPPPVPTHAGPLGEALRHMLAADPDDRWSMERVASELRQVAAGAPGTRLLPAPPPTEPPEPTPTREVVAGAPRRSRALPLLLVALVVLAAVAASGWWLVRDRDPDPAGTGAPSAERSPEASPRATRSEPTADSEPSEPETASDEAAPEGSATPATGGALTGFVSDYYALLPEDPDAAWEMLSPGAQGAVGRGTYDGFWATIDDVRVDEVTADGPTVTVTLTYTTDGRTEQETRRLTVEDEGDGLLITGDEGAV